MIVLILQRQDLESSCLKVYKMFVTIAISFAKILCYICMKLGLYKVTKVTEPDL